MRQISALLPSKSKTPVTPLALGLAACPCETCLRPAGRRKGSGSPLTCLMTASFPGPLGGQLAGAQGRGVSDGLPPVLRGRGARVLRAGAVALQPPGTRGGRTQGAYQRHGTPRALLTPHTHTRGRPGRATGLVAAFGNPLLPSTAWGEPEELGEGGGERCRTCADVPAGRCSARRSWRASGSPACRRGSCGAAG